MFLTYQCEKCLHKTEFNKKYGIEAPKKLTCSSCGKKAAIRFFGPGIATIVPVGNLGNAKDGYTGRTK